MSKSKYKKIDGKLSKQQPDILISRAELVSTKYRLDVEIKDIERCIEDAKNLIDSFQEIIKTYRVQKKQKEDMLEDIRADIEACDELNVPPLQDE